MNKKRKGAAVTLQSFDIHFYTQDNGSCPIKYFLDSLDSKMRAQVLRTIDLLRQSGNELREPYSKSLGDGIFELRVKQATDISRVLYFFVIGHKIVLTNGFIKKTKKTPVSEIDLAKKYRENYLLRKEDE